MPSSGQATAHFCELRAHRGLLGNSPFSSYVRLGGDPTGTRKPAVLSTRVLDVSAVEIQHQVLVQPEMEKQHFLELQIMHSRRKSSVDDSAAIETKLVHCASPRLESRGRWPLGWT
jgi:hypothetical protein